jgi:quercetin dioxygenase-like cupin family protein
MKTICRNALFSISILATALAPSLAHALEQSASVKATTILKTDSSWNGAPLAYPDGKPEITGMLIEIAPGGETGWHLHPVMSFGMVLEGDLQVQLKSGETKRFKAGDGLAEVVNTLHNGRNVGDGTVKLIVFYAGSVGGKLTVKEDAKKEGAQ